MGGCNISCFEHLDSANLLVTKSPGSSLQGWEAYRIVLYFGTY